jgi:hypothetical protein
MAAFHLIIYGRFWVITEGESNPESEVLSAHGQRQKRTERSRRAMAKDDARHRPVLWRILRIAVRSDEDEHS